MSWIRLAIDLAVLAIIVRLVLLFPALAMKEPAANPIEALRKSWRRTKGLWWTIFASDLVAALPILLPLGLAFVVIFILIDINLALGEMIFPWAQAIAEAFSTVVGAALGAAVASHVYRYVTRSAA